MADTLALGWYEGIGREAASERWAFAFSAMEESRSKVAADVAKAAETGRGYSKIFFVSSQYVRDKARAEVEDKLRVKHGLDVRILDRSWILDKVFTNGHESLAVEDLRIATSSRSGKRRGPLDTQREIDLREIEDRIRKALREGNLGFQLAEDCIEAANLARGLERPRTEVEGLYQRAEQIVVKRGTSHQRLEAAYQWAWTAFWWYEDYEQFHKAYTVAEQRAKGSGNVHDLELLCNLWSLLRGAANRGKLDKRLATVSSRTALLCGELDRLSRDAGQPSAALHARTLQFQMRLILGFAKGRSMDGVLREFQKVVGRCEGLAGFPVEHLVEVLAELGEPLGGLPAYDQLFETVVAVRARRRGEIAAADMLLVRGEQQLRADRPYDAIRTLGRSLRQFYKHESRADAVHALYSCGCAYERVGLLWAARGTLLSAASLAAGEWWKYGDVTMPQAACYRRIKWLELQLGRIPQALSWHEVDMAVRAILIEKCAIKNDPFEEALAFDAALGLLFLKTEHWDLKRLSALPDILDRLGLPSSCLALKYALGYEDELRETVFIEAGADKDMHAFFLKWRDQPASTDLPKRPSLYEEKKVTLKSRVLGCDVTVESDNVRPCVELSESLLAALESLLSTGTVEHMAAREPVLTIAVRRSDFVKQPFEFELQDDTGRPHISITCAGFDAHILSKGSPGGGQGQASRRSHVNFCQGRRHSRLPRDPGEAISR